MQPVVELGFHSSSVKVCERNVLSGLGAHSGISKSEASALIDLATRSAKMLMFESFTTVGLGFNSAAIHDVSYETLFVASELGASKPGLSGLRKGPVAK